MKTDAAQADTGPTTRQGLALLAAATRGDEAGLTLLLADVHRDDRDLVRFLAVFASQWIMDTAAERGSPPDRAAGLFSAAILTSAHGEVR